MPELPEVQTIVNDLNKKVIGKKIAGVWFDAPKIITIRPFNKFRVAPNYIEGRQAHGDGEQSRTIKKPKAKDLEKQIKGLKIEKISRKGKNILIYLGTSYKIQDTKYLLLVHQKMTGHLMYGKWRVKKVFRPRRISQSETSSKLQVSSMLPGAFQEKVNDYIHFILYLDNGWQIALSDLRKFAKILFGVKNEIENSPDVAKIGPDLMDKNFTFTVFKNVIAGQKGKIKQVLMEQNIVAGIGNIYSDEILFAAKIHPFKPANKLSDAELKKIYSAIKAILKKALKLRGTSISDYRDASGKLGKYAEKRLVYRREGEKCPRRCGGIVKRVKMGGRSAHYCPVCQKL